MDLILMWLVGLFLLSPSIMFLNGKGGGKQALEGLFVQCEVKPSRAGPRCGHGRAGREAHQTSTIVVQVWIVGNERKRKLFWEGFPFEGARLEEIDENRLRK